MTKILLVGDSHLGAVKRAHDANPERYPSFSFAYLGKGGLAKTRFFDGRSVASCKHISDFTRDVMENARALATAPTR